jgi:hypothetical protein
LEIFSVLKDQLIKFLLLLRWLLTVLLLSLRFKLSYNLVALLSLKSSSCMEFLSDSLFITDSLSSFLIYLCSLNLLINSIPFSLNELFLPLYILLLSDVSLINCLSKMLLLLLDVLRSIYEFTFLFKFLKNSVGALLFLEAWFF